MKRGFTLVELMVVLLIIAAVTHLATRELTKFGEAKMTAAADRQLEEIRAAALKFGVDTGRPLKLAENGTLEELWKKPDDVEEYQIKSNGVKIAGGWRGPYLKLPIGKSALYDPWGNEFKYEAGAEFERVSVTNESDIVNEVTLVAHFGPDSLLDARREISLLPSGGWEHKLLVNLSADSEANISELKAYQWQAGEIKELEVTGAGQYIVKAVNIPGEIVFELMLADGDGTLSTSTKRIRHLQLSEKQFSVEVKVK